MDDVQLRVPISGRPSWCGKPGCFVHAPTTSPSPADLIAVVRRGVESGTIKGEVGRVEGASVMSQEHTELLVWVSRDVAREIVCGGVDVLVIPVSDGGSET